MKPSYEKLPVGPERSLQVKHFSMAYFDSPFHFHPEYELTYIVRGSGLRFVGDHVGSFIPGDLVLLGPNLPHFWQSSREHYQQDSPLECEAIVLHFSEQLVDTLSKAIPEFEGIRSLASVARSGLFFDPEGLGDITQLLTRLESQSPGSRLIDFLQVLNLLSQTPSPVQLAGTSFQPTTSFLETERMQRILEHSLLSFREPITLSEIAAIAHLSEAAFCRYFKKRCQKPYFSYLNELRIGHARQLLSSSWLSIGQIALESGFSNLSHFHRQFQRLTGVSPLRYRQLYQKLPKEKVVLKR
jgi:AraC-like DNA-binding protein